ncbi:cytoplasmic protein [Serratia marcescens]|uniref:Cytoplasmic protein n=1 Tax=Serratia marcescens TaxID=615 RepID=A0A1Q4P2V2_SERMA|nr:cupin domain-containing protein [Serratia marcescens]OKB67433.1 cytoplasmic protein [Serratia marcescens]
MKPLLLKQPLPELLEIGSVSNLGATVIAGTPTVGVASIFGEPTDNLNCGVFSCTRGSFAMEYPFAEHATVWEGSATLTNERTGESVQYQAGDSWFVEKGTPVRWDITSDRFVKHYLAIVEG